MAEATSPAHSSDASLAQLHAWIASRPPPPLAVGQQPADDAQEVLSGVWISNRATSRNVDWLTKVAVTDVISMTRQEADAPLLDQYRTLGVEYHSFGLNDSQSQAFLAIGEQAADLIADIRARHGTVLVHCDQGRSRSPAVVLLYLMKAQSLGYEEAFATIARVRRIQPNASFEAELRAYAGMAVRRLGADLATTIGSSEPPCPLDAT